MSDKLKLIFMGTPDFAKRCLEGLLETDAEIPLVISQPDRPKGRGLKLTPSPVKSLALSRGIDVITPIKLKEEETLKRIKEIDPDLLWVAAYGKILPKSILKMPKMHPINVHASLLPKYRGAAPINWAIIRGENKTGITIMKMSPKMDEGDVMLRTELEIKNEDNAGTLHDRLADLSKKVTKKAYKILANGDEKFEAQNHELATYAPTLKKDDGIIDWNKTSEEIHNFVRGMNPWPGAHSYLNGKMIKIFKTDIKNTIKDQTETRPSPGEVIGIYKGSISVKTGNGNILVRELQAESRKRMSVDAFTAGSDVSLGDRFTSKK